MGHPHKGSNKRRGKKQSQPISNLKQPGCQNPTFGQTTEESMVLSSLMKTEQSGLFNFTIVEEDDDAAVLIGDMTDTTTLLSDDDNRTILLLISQIMLHISWNSSYEIILAEVLKTMEAMPDLSEPSPELSNSREYHNSNTTIEPVRAYFEKCSTHCPGRTAYLPSSSNHDLQGHMSCMSCYGRSHIDVLAGLGTSSEQTQTQDVKEKNKLYEHDLSSNKRIGVQCGPTPTDVEKNWPALSPIKPSFEFSKNRQQHNSNIEVVSDVLKENYVLIGGDSYIASSSNSDLQEGNMSFKRSWLEALVGPETSYEHTLTQEVKGKIPLHDPNSWVKVVKKGSHMQKLDYLSKDTAKKQHIPGGDYKKYRHNANQHWENQKSLVEQARKAHASGKWDEGVNLYEKVIGVVLGFKPEHHLSWRHCDLPPHVCQGFKSQQPQCVKVRILIWIKLLVGKDMERKAEQADERASQDIFYSRNKNNIVDLMTIDLHGQHVKEGMTILKYHLAFGVYGRSLRRLRVITGYGSGGTGQSMLKLAVVDLLKTEKFEWEKENEGSLLIKFDMKKRKLGFVKL
ncbi:unnamed protein product [Lactuca virosa]|uniref:Smr domain-containing protein n=1 Tax=Lactuca virosa TaxID=75947 RepID=A0AAU9PJ52_9ASTR|nr:unnamed protein product [Lactuca virosa]